MNHQSENINELAAALVKAQAVFKTVAANKMVNAKAFTYKYATLATIMDAIRGLLTDNGLAITQPIVGNDLLTILLHTSGQYIISTVPIPLSADVKGFGANLSYMRRYAITSLIGIAIDEEDDEQMATGRVAPKNIKIDTQTGEVIAQPVMAINGTSTTGPDIPTNPQALTDAVNAALGEKYYNAPNHIYNALGKIPWPKPEDKSSWADVYAAALDHARQQLAEKAGK